MCHFQMPFDHFHSNSSLRSRMINAATDIMVSVTEEDFDDALFAVVNLLTFMKQFFLSLTLLAYAAIGSHQIPLDV